MDKFKNQLIDIESGWNCIEADQFLTQTIYLYAVLGASPIKLCHLNCESYNSDNYDIVIKFSVMPLTPSLN